MIRNIKVKNHKGIDSLILKDLGQINIICGKNKKEVIMIRVFGTVVMALALAACLLGCMPSLENHFLDVQIYPDDKAPYIGEWTAAVTLALWSLKINPDGTVFACTSNDATDNEWGKVYRENDKTNIVFESGAIFQITSVTDDKMIINAYTVTFNFLRGNVPPNCVKYFAGT